MNSTIGLDVEFRPIPIPERIDAPDAADFVEMTRVRNEVYREIEGGNDSARTPQELLPHYRPSAHETRVLLGVLVDGRLVGRVGVDIPHEEGSRVAYWQIELLRSHHGRGIGRAAYRLVEKTAIEHGRTVLQSWAQHSEAPGPRLDAPTGFGSVPLDRAARFFLASGYTLEQIDRRSDLDLVSSRDTVDRLLDEARAASAGYRVVQWMAPTPREFREEFAWLKSRMSTDAPSAGMEIDEEAWDVERVIENDRRWTDGGRLVQVTAAQHEDSGRLVAFNELSIGEERTQATSQEDTLVLKEHRGHRLGLLVKCAGLVSWRDVAPDSPKVITFNAEENRPMLDINEAIGFVPVAYEGAWKKVLA